METCNLSKIETLNESNATDLEIESTEPLVVRPEWVARLILNNGEEKTYSDSTLVQGLIKDIQIYDLPPDQIIEVNQMKTDESFEIISMPLIDFAKSFFSLRVIFQPIWSYALEGLKWGVIAGIVLKLIDTTILLGSVNPELAFLFIAAIGACFIPRIGIVAVIILSIVMSKYTGANLFMIALSAALTGAILGCLPGMFIGGIIGFVRKNRHTFTFHLLAEPKYVILKSILMPFTGAVALILFYLFVFNPWLMELLSA